MFTLRFAKRTSGHYPAHEFLEWLKGKDGNSHSKFLHLFKKVAELNPDELHGLCKNLQGSGAGLIELTIWKYRVLGFRRKDEIFLTNGFKKDQNETPLEEITRAHDIRREHIAAEVKK